MSTEKDDGFEPQQETRELGQQHDVAGSVSHSDDPDDFGYSPKEQKKIMRHVDRRLVVTVGLMYCVSLMDRTNMSFASIAGMRDELVLEKLRYVRSTFLPLFLLLSARN